MMMSAAAASSRTGAGFTGGGTIIGRSSIRLFELLTDACGHPARETLVRLDRQDRRLHLAVGAPDFARKQRSWEILGIAAFPCGRSISLTSETL
jgi:hypothetical protein